jgi:glucans biosynthesis protein C
MSKPSLNPSGSARFHSLDSLRACMMLLGIWFHASCSYATLAIPAWHFKDASTSAIFDVSVLLIHVFRMPIFFALAGFFARFAWQRVGTRAFLRNRTTRILLPFVVGWPILFVITQMGSGYAASLATHAPLPWLTGDFYRSGKIFSVLVTMHLWFLYYLIFLYLLFMAMAAVVRRCVSADWQEQAERRFRRLLSSPWRSLILAVPTCIPLYFMRTATLETDASFLVQPKTLFAYAIFFGFGWLLYRQADLLPGFRKHAWRQVLVALLISPLYFLSIQRSLRAIPPMGLGLHVFAVISGSIVVWLFVFGIMGLFIRYLDRSSAKIRYLADASYWMYLVHLPLMIWIPLAIRSLHLPAVVKFIIVLTISVPVLLASYEWCVRYTIIGRVLNGPRKRTPTPAVIITTIHETIAAGQRSQS